jgi:hydrophobic/amphiphilic exporter-1 (mainly G- bacteria), HAE1 family
MIRLAIRRPVAVTMAYVAVALLGVAAWRGIPLELLPDTQLPRLSVQVGWPGASPEAMEAAVTSPIEGAIQLGRGVEKVSSTSVPGRASIQVEFSRRTDMDFARIEVAERLAALRGTLPPRVTPHVLPYVPREFRDQQRPFLEYTVTGPYTPEALRAHVQDVIAPEINQVRGVNDVEVSGGRDRLLEIELDARRVEALGLSPFTVQQRIQDLEYVRDAGMVATAGGLRTVAIRHRAGSIDDILRLPLLTDQGRVVRVSDVARIHDTYEEPRGYYRIDGYPAVGFTVHKEHGSNVVRLADAVRARVDGLEALHPPGVRLILDQDQSEAVRTQLSDLRNRALFAAVAIFLVLLLFLGSLRSAAIVFTTIAFSVLITLNLIYWGGLTLNVLTLMGLAMGFGLMVDNAIVVLENVYRRRKLGDSPAAAAERGAGDVVLPIFAATLTTVVVLVPFVYLQGELQAYYVPLAIVVGFSLVASLFVAFSFIPGVAARSLGRLQPDPPGRAARPWYLRLLGGLVGFTVRHPVVTVLLAALLLGYSWRQFDEHVTRGVVWGAWWGQQDHIDIQVRMPRGEDIERVDALTRSFEERLRAMPEVGRFVTQVNPSASHTRVTFPAELEGTGVPEAIKERLVAYSHRYGGVDVRVYGYGPSFYGGGGSPPGYSIQVNGYNYDKVREIAEDLGRRLEHFSRIREVDTNSGGRWVRERETELVLELDRAGLALHELSARDVVRQVSAATRGDAGQSELRVGGEEMRFAVKLAGNRELDLLGLHELLIPSPAGPAVRLADVARLSERSVLARIEREDQRYRRFVAYEFRGPTRLGDRVQEAVMEATFLPPGYSIESGTYWRWAPEERRQIYGVLALALALVFMATAALFESLRQPLTVLLTVPMALIGVFLIFRHTGASFTREAYIGVIMMAGIVVNNAILLVDHVNRLRRVERLPLEAATRRGTLERVRPILMTSTTTIVGLLPLVLFATSANENIWNALAYALIGGLASSTVLVLTVTPALYLLLERGPERRRLARLEREAGLVGRSEARLHVHAEGAR